MSVQATKQHLNYSYNKWVITRTILAIHRFMQLSPNHFFSHRRSCVMFKTVTEVRKNESGVWEFGRLNHDGLFITRVA